MIVSPGRYIFLSAALVVVMSAVSIIDGSPGGESPVRPVPGSVSRPGREVGVGVVAVALLAKLPVVFETVPLISSLVLVFAARLGSVAAPVQGRQLAPLSVLNCGFRTLEGTLSVTVGVAAVAGPELYTVMV